MLLSLGYTCLSMNYSELSRVKYITRRVSFADLQNVGAKALSLESADEIHNLYSEYAANQGLSRIIALNEDVRLNNK